MTRVQQEVRLREITIFLQSEGLLNDSFILKTREQKTTYLPLLNTICIDLDYEQYDKEIMDMTGRITVGDEIDLLNHFTEMDLIYFHELGHLFDFELRQKKKVRLAKKDSKSVGKMNNKISKVISNVIANPNFNPDTESILALETMNQMMYRKLNAREAIADRNARLLARYIIEHYPAL